MHVNISLLLVVVAVLLYKHNKCQRVGQNILSKAIPESKSNFPGNGSRRFPSPWKLVMRCIH